jgi:superfamily II DNA/RNA helicase
MTFKDLNLSTPLLLALEKQGYEMPTPIQQQAIPIALNGENLIAAAQTGTGKTAAFVLPIIERLSRSETQRKKRVRAIILAPTRELAIQVNRSIENYAVGSHIRSFAIYGGVEYQGQKQALIDGVDIVVATPGRLIDLYGQHAIHFDEVETLVLDEADRMLDMGFIDDINKVLDRLPQDIQFLLFSATLSKPVRELAKSAIAQAHEIVLAKFEASKAQINQWMVSVDKDKKSALLAHLLTTGHWAQALIFIETKHGAAKLVQQLEKRGISSEAIHSGRNQASRIRVLEEFKQGKLKYLIATGVAARGIDIESLPCVINYDLPFPADEYIHRIGRTGRAGSSGEAISLVSKDNFKNLCMIESRLGHLLERRVIDGFVPIKDVPISILNYVPQYKRVNQE